MFVRETPACTKHVDFKRPQGDVAQLFANTSIKAARVDVPGRPFALYWRASDRDIIAIVTREFGSRRFSCRAVVKFSPNRCLARVFWLVRLAFVPLLRCTFYVANNESNGTSDMAHLALDVPGPAP